MRFLCALVFVLFVTLVLAAVPAAATTCESLSNLKLPDTTINPHAVCCGQRG